MDEQSQVGAAQRRRNRAEAAQLVAEYEGSGLSRVEFRRKQGLSSATLARYRKRQAQGEVVAGSRWVAVDISGADARSRAGRGLAVALPGGLRIQVGRGGRMGSASAG